MVFSKRMGGYSTTFDSGAGAKSPAYKEIVTDGMEDETEEINGVGSGDSTTFDNSTILLEGYKDWVLEYLGS
jgi:hypothetical protein